MTGRSSIQLWYRSIAVAHSGVDVRGRIWIDAETYQIRRLELEYLRGDDPYAEVAVDYADVTIGGKAIRLPGSGEGTLRPGGIGKALVKRATGKFAFAYDRIAGSQRSLEP